MTHHCSPAMRATSLGCLAFEDNTGASKCENFAGDRCVVVSQESKHIMYIYRQYESNSIYIYIYIFIKKNIVRYHQQKPEHTKEWDNRSTANP